MIKFFFILLLFPVFCHAQSTEILDIKNGFLQFHLGDSILKYKDVLDKPEKKFPTQYRVKGKGFGRLKSYIDHIIVTANDGTINEIELYILKVNDAGYMDGLMKKAYGEGLTIIEDNGVEAGVIHRSAYLWEGKRVTAVVKKTRSFSEANGMPLEIMVENIIFKKTGNAEISGELPADFPL